MCDMNGFTGGHCEDAQLNACPKLPIPEPRAVPPAIAAAIARAGTGPSNLPEYEPIDRAGDAAEAAGEEMQRWEPALEKARSTVCNMGKHDFYYAKETLTRFWVKSCGNVVGADPSPRQRVWLALCVIFEASLGKDTPDRVPITEWGRVGMMVFGNPSQFFDMMNGGGAFAAALAQPSLRYEAASVADEVLAILTKGSEVAMKAVVPKQRGPCTDALREDTVYYPVYDGTLLSAEEVYDDPARGKHEWGAGITAVVLPYIYIQIGLWNLQRHLGL
eukprot:TRINITY_DN33269_c0_g1_i1.p2 TRINITY_DN33269_c0_g1~~TRINITY_DN33269_c0_g1_i1.p2  ORF type:complete len:275 (+),score=83.76 TRINITY_DN33269_c0_g1_i1:36-860(+)